MGGGPSWMLDSRQSLDPVGDTQRLELEIRRLIVEVAKLHDLVPEQIDQRAPLVQSLGLDSLDALQIAAALAQRYGVAPDADRLFNESISLRSLVALVIAGRARK
jgi:acyl carrier protein